MSLDLNSICSQVVSLDRSVRFAGIVNKMGKVVAHKFREGVIPVLSFQELEASAMGSVLRMKTREDSESKLGKAIYTFTLYEKVKRASIPIQWGDCVLAIVSFENEAEHERIILTRILPLLRKEGLVQKST